MSDFKAKMHQIRFRLGLPQTQLGELTALSRPPSYVALLLREREGEGRGEEGKEGEREGMRSPPLQSYFDHCTHSMLKIKIWGQELHVV